MGEAEGGGRTPEAEQANRTSSWRLAVLLGASHAAQASLSPRRCCGRVSAVQSEGRASGQSGEGGGSEASAPSAWGCPAAQSEGRYVLCRLEPLEPPVETRSPLASVRLASGNQPGRSARQDRAPSLRLDVPVATPEPGNGLMDAAKGAAGGLSRDLERGR